MTRYTVFYFYAVNRTHRRLVSKPADYERRDHRSTKTPQTLSRPSPDYSVGSIVAHEASVVERLRAFFRDANRRPA